MKDFILPVSTPFSQSNALSTLSTPNRLGNPSHYFDSSHQAGVAQLHDCYSQLHWEGQDYTPLGLLSPIHSIPNEILALIVELGYFECNGGPSPDTAFRSLLSQISRKFRQLVLHTPSVWSVIQLSPRNIVAEMDRLPVYLARSKDYPLDIQMNCFWPEHLMDFAIDLLVPHSKRWRSLSITSAHEHIFSLIQHTPVPLLDSLHLCHYSNQRRVTLPSPMLGGHLPKLSNLSIRNVDLENLEFSLRNLQTLEIRGYGIWPKFSQLNNVLANSQTLERLILHVKPGDVLEQVLQEPTESRDAQILLPGLRNFEVHTSEWLSTKLTALINLFACPKLQSLVVRESTSTPNQFGHTLMTYTSDTGTSPNFLLPSSGPTLSVWSASLYLSCSSIPSTSLTTLELRDVTWPLLSLMKTTFASLKKLQTLVLLKLKPTEALLQILAAGLDGSSMSEASSSVTIPTLTSLVIEFEPSSNSNVFASKDRTAAFIQLFSLPRLSSLILRNLSGLQWMDVTTSFRYRASQYPALTSLSLKDMTDIIAIDPSASGYSNTAEAFPLLQHLSLTRVHSNSFMQHLLPQPASLPSQPANSCAWPDLRTLLICGDPNVSRPLLHRIITARECTGMPLKKLYLDSQFPKNLDSWDWIREHVDVELVVLPAPSL
ncbi:hypothetical protein B0H34DRAFT_801344 [Crassisporium funariophilum]|nr:hypothetical protein B0H34DRAFT_801344 [Crassisporium funariophilum]